MRAVVALDGPRAQELAEELRDEGVEVRAVVGAAEPAAAIVDAMSTPEAAELLAELARAQLLVVPGRPATLTAELVSACDRIGVRIAPLCSRGSERRLAAGCGLIAHDRDATAAELIAAPSARVAAPASDGRVIAVWGPHGAPGRTTIALGLACELAREGRRVGLVDADTHAPALALATGLADEGPGFAAACRQAERGTLTTAELTRIALALGDVDVLTGINRPARWTELGHERVRAALVACRPWADDTVVDIAAALERDEEIVSDLDGPRRNAATHAALAEADLVVAVVAADPVGVSRFVRAYPDLRAAAGAVPVRVVVNKLRPGPLGIDARGQVRRTLERYAGVGDVWFVPWDGKAADAALLAARSVSQVSPRSALATAVRRFAGEAVIPPVVAASRRERAPRATRRRLARTA